MRLYGKDWNREDLEKHVSNINQLFGIKRFVHDEGKEKGVEIIQVRTGAGLVFHISPTKGMDILDAEYNGISIGWKSANGDTNPYFYDSYKGKWDQTASGGLMMTCGLTQVGTPNIFDGEELGLHGRVHHIPAHSVTISNEWINNEYVMIIKGIVEESTFFGRNLRLSREYKIIAGSNKVYINDVIKNMGYDKVPHMILYHFNFGFPFLNETTKIKFPSNIIKSRDEGINIKHFDSWEEPKPDTLEKVYYHSDFEEKNKYKTVTIISKEVEILKNLSTSLIAKISWDTRTLPFLTQWKQNNSGMNVLGIEPGNCHVEGRSKENELGSLVYLEPKKEVKYKLKFDISYELD